MKKISGKRLIQIMVHTLGLSSVVAAFCIQFIMLFDIATQGYFRAIEPNPVVLAGEVVLAIFGLSYFLVIMMKRFSDAK